MEGDLPEPWTAFALALNRVLRLPGGGNVIFGQDQFARAELLRQPGHAGISRRIEYQDALIDRALYSLDTQRLEHSMALYVDSAFLDDITTTAQSLPLAGVTTNPTILRAARERGQKLDHLEVLTALLSRVPGTIFMQPGSPDEEEMYQQARTYILAAPGRVIPKIPMTGMGMRVAHRLKQQGYRVSFTAVTTVAQAYSAALAGADFVIPYYGRLENSGIDASKRIGEIATVLSRAELPTRILAAS